MQLFDSPVDMEPLLPREAVLDHVLSKAHDLRAEAAKLSGMCQSSVTSELASLLSAMNSYYSNKIEGEHTRPLDLERALRQDFSTNKDKSRLQRLAVAHIRSEHWIRTQDWQVPALYTAEAVQQLHGHLFRQLSLEDRTSTDAGTGETLIAEPGELRQRNVVIARHIAPDFKIIPVMLERWGSVYGQVRRGEMAIVAAAAAHHRQLWIHAFIDGNGRAARLHSLALLQALALTDGLWSPLRGFARGAERYAEKLGNADMPRAGDLDGRGQRSEKFLVEWIDYFLDVCLDQVRFMTVTLNLNAMLDRLSALLLHEQKIVKSGVRIEALRPLHYLFATQSELDRGAFSAMSGLQERTASTMIARLLERGLLKSDSRVGPLRFGIPLHGLRFLFPNLWPEAEADAATQGADS